MATAEGCRRPGLVSDDLNTQLQPQANSFVCIFFFLSLLLALLLNKSVNKYELGRLLLKLCICAQPLPSTPPPTSNHPQPLTRPSVPPTRSPSVQHVMKHYSPEFHSSSASRRRRCWICRGQVCVSCKCVLVSRRI